MLRRIHPEPAADVTWRECYDVARPHPGRRPWIGVCMVASLDGSTVVDGRSGGLSNAHDSELLLTLRELAGLIVVGAGTVRAEGYSAPRRAGLRVGVVTNSGAVDTSSPLFTSGAGFLILPESAPATTIETVRSGEHAVDLVDAFTQLDEWVGAGFVHVEGGPRLNASLADADLIDELNLTLSPRLAGGSGPRLTDGGASLATAFELAHVVIDEDWFVFSRWSRSSAC